MSDTPPNPDLFSYLDFRAYIRDWFAARKAVDPKLTHRGFVRSAGMRSPSVLVNIMAGKRNLSAESTESFSAAMGLDEEERTFFRALVALGQATTDDERNDAYAIVAAERRFRSAHRLAESLQLPLALVPASGPPGWPTGPTSRPTRADRGAVAPTDRTGIEAAQALATLQTLGLLSPTDDGESSPPTRRASSRRASSSTWPRATTTGR